ncbi:Probable fructose-bisphosphate aldolase [uncultured Clostridium sp.]|nr:class II fructose-bisphosphate aldolase [Clostridium sp.]SCI18845.1 Probable fructose-bisphosphate aldolase [uncultured Clostridium sp.]
MLVNMNQVLQYAEDRRCCIGAFDTPNLEILMAVLGAAEKRNEPVIIQHAQLHECETSIDVIGPIMVRMAKDAQVPVCVMLDHGEDIEYVKRALDIGFSAVMYDGSSLSYEENVRMTKEAVALAKAAGADVEAEIGIVTGHEGREFGLKEVSEAYTDPDLAARYVKDTGIDALAASVGTVHGFYTTKPNLDFERIVKIRELTGIPLVMHGGSGISVEDTQKAIRCGIRKINYFSYMSNAGVKAVKKLLEEKEVKYFHDLAKAAVDAMEADVLKAMAMFALE